MLRKNVLLCGRFFCRMRRECLSTAVGKRKRPARGWPLKAGEERLLRPAASRSSCALSVFSHGKCYDQSDRMLRFLCRSGAADPALNQTVWAQVEEFTYQQSQLLEGTFSVPKVSTMMEVGSATRLRRKPEFHNDRPGQQQQCFRDITCCVGCGTVHF